MNYTCPYCNQPTTITEPNNHNFWEHVDIDIKRQNYEHELGVGFSVIVCPNEECKEVSLTAMISGAKEYINPQRRSFWVRDTSILNKEWSLLPQSSAKPQPDYIPKQIIQDYTEACLIRELSPKSSATLARRCLQGMIRDYHGIKKDKLFDAINELKAVVPSGEWEAIDALRSIGNIGAHMEKDVDLIIDIDTDEAKKLIGFIEYLFKQWYVKRHDDQKNLADLRAMAGIKQEQRKGN